MRTVVFALSLALLAVPATAQTKSCDELKTEIEGRIKQNGVKEFTLDVVPAADVKDATVVGSCEGGAKKITYKRGAA